MTVVSIDTDAKAFAVDVSRESLNKTAGLDTTGPVNLEKAMRLSDRLGGHLVSGHVDDVACIEFARASR
jgi:riboflavin synthase